jgi:tRNA-Thr(GGU) m(6)t(6)A37 methyltransferase TsaA
METRHGYELTVIGRIRSPFEEKFGIPRQSGLAPAAVGEVVLMPPFDRDEMVKGLEKFSHIWLIFLFDQAMAEGWRPQVRPPRLGGRQKVGVFASRSPHRPNHLGMSAARFFGVSRLPQGLVLHVTGIDLLDNTPLIDIKPYLPATDSIAGASDGFLITPPLAVMAHPQVKQFCRDYQEETGRNLWQLLAECLACDPRPASQRDEREFGMRLWDVNIRFRVRQAAVAEALTADFAPSQYHSSVR